MAGWNTERSGRMADILSMGVAYEKARLAMVMSLRECIVVGRSSGPFPLAGAHGLLLSSLTAAIE